MSRHQRFYRHLVVAALIVAGACSLAAALTLAARLDPPTHDRPLLPLAAIAVVAVFVLAYVALRLLAGQPLALPIGNSLLRALTFTLMAALVGVMLYGFQRWPSAPLRSSDVGFVDKARRVYTRDEFVEFKRWETAFVLLFVAGSVLLVSEIPSQPKRPRWLRRDEGGRSKDDR